MFKMLYLYILCVRVIYTDYTSYTYIEYLENVYYKIVVSWKLNIAQYKHDMLILCLFGRKATAYR